MYEKLNHIEPPVAAALVRYCGRELRACLDLMKGAPPEPLPGLRIRVLDGNHLTGTEHRPTELRCTRAAALPGKTLVFYEPGCDLITDIVPCEDAYTQERALADQALALVATNDCVVGDRNFCTSKFLFGIAAAGAFFVIRQHGSNLSWQAVDEARPAGQDDSGRELQEQAIKVTDPRSGQTQTVRRIIIPLRKKDEEGETSLQVLTNLSAQQATAQQVADLYAQRWTVENAFQQLTDDLRAEINTLAYPEAALFGFCTACVAYNAVSLVKAALRATQGNEFVKEKLSMYYLTLEVARVTPGMEIAIADTEWSIFRHMTLAEFVDTIVTLAKGIRPEKYTKHKRGPKKPPPKKTKGKHVSTARVLAGRKRNTP